MVHQWGQRLSRGLISILNVLNPEQVVIGGPLTILLPYVEEQLNQSLERQLPAMEKQDFLILLIPDGKFLSLARMLQLLAVRYLSINPCFKFQA